MRAIHAICAFAGHHGPVLGSGGRRAQKRIGLWAWLNAVSGRRRSAHCGIESGRGLVPARLRALTKAGPRPGAPGRLRKDLVVR